MFVFCFVFVIVLRWSHVVQFVLSANLSMFSFFSSIFWLPFRLQVLCIRYVYFFAIQFYVLYCLTSVRVWVRVREHWNTLTNWISENVKCLAFLFRWFFMLFLWCFNFCSAYLLVNAAEFLMFLRSFSIVTDKKKTLHTKKEINNSRFQILSWLKKGLKTIRQWGRLMKHSDQTKSKKRNGEWNESRMSPV